jgi:predicted MPP superfamily phosphohydrolase
MTPRVVLTLFTVLLNGGYAALLIWQLRRRAPWPRFLAVTICLWALLMIGFFAIQIFQPEGWTDFLRSWFYLPLAVGIIWNILFVQFLFLGSIVVVLVVRRLRPDTATRPMTPHEISRRKFLYLVSYGAAPSLALGMGVHGSLTRNDLRVREYSIPIAGLPPELEGFRIAHVSDLHSGIFVGPDRLKIISQAANDLKADLVAITGDVINRSMSEFPAALTAMQEIESRYGTWLCEGNHDVIPGRGLDACMKNNLPMLYSSSAIVPVNGRRLVLGGLPWLRRGFEGRPEIVSRLFPDRQEGDVRILLAHHPHLFDIAGSADLVLTGHTHGGQIMLGKDVGLGPLFFKYWSGPYVQGKTTMIVSNGCGDWFPCRIGAPAEIGLLRLSAGSVA